MTVANKRLAPEDALPRMSNDTPEMVQARGEYAADVRQRLVLDPSKMNFSSRGIATVEWRNEDGDWQVLNLPVKSISAHVTDSILDRHRIDPGAIPQKYDDEAKAWTRDEESPEFLEWQTRAMSMVIRIRYEKLLYALDADIQSVNGDGVVWSSSHPEVRDRDAALESLHALSIPSEQLTAINEIIDNLSIKTEVEKAEDFKKKQP